MRPSRLVCFLALTGCATAGAGGPGNGPTRVVPSSNGGTILVNQDVQSSDSTISAAPDTAWAALGAVYRSLEIPVTMVDQAHHQLGNRDLELTRGRIAGQAMSAYFDCGGSMTGPIANSARLRIDVVSRVEPAPSGGTVLSTRATATALSTNGTSTGAGACSSTGRLESLIAQRVERYLGR
ncbi:MAG TPA: hypothetical protein VFL93_01600 [Longimicrobiaceae bacterium]|nr:hypothetical protein [Longimicrobiaceae bacterium]